MRLRTVACCVLLLLALLSSCARPDTPKSKDVRVSAERMDAAEPAATAGLDGTVYMAWVEHRGKDADVWLSHFDSEGRPLGQAARVNTNAGEATAWRGDPPTLAVARDGTVYVVWTARDDAAPHATTLYLSGSHDGGRSFGPPSKVNDDAKPCVHGMHSLAVSADGRVYVAWLDERNVESPKPSESGPVHMHLESNRELFFASSDDGGRTFSPNQRVAGEVCPCCKTSLAVSTDGRVYIAWRQVLPGNFRHIAVASSDDGGQTFNAPTVVSDDRWEIQGCPVSGPALAAAAGSLHVLWYTAGEAGRPGLYWSESLDGGRTFSLRRTLAETGGRGTPVLLKSEGDDLTVVWEGVDDASPAAIQTRLDGDGRVTTAAVLAKGGELPAATEVAGQLFVVYIKEEGDSHSVWMAKTRKG